MKPIKVTIAKKSPNAMQKAQDKAKEILKDKDLSKLSQAEVRELVVELAKMHGLV